MQPTTKKKIPLPDWIHPTSNIIAEKSIRYWALAQCWNGRVTNSLTITDAMHAANAVLDDLSPTKPLHSKTESLKNNIIVHGTKAKMLRTIANPNANVNTKDPNIVVPKIYVL